MLCTQRKEITLPIQYANNFLAISDKEKSNLLGNHLADISHALTDVNPNPKKLEMIYNFLNSPLPMSLPIKPIILTKI